MLTVCQNLQFCVPPVSAAGDQHCHLHRYLRPPVVSFLTLADPFVNVLVSARWSFEKPGLLDVRGPPAVSLYMTGRGGGA